MPSSHHPSSISQYILYTHQQSQTLQTRYIHQEQLLSQIGMREKKSRKKKQLGGSKVDSSVRVPTYALYHICLFLLNRSSFLKFFQKVSVTFPVFEFKSHSVMFWEIYSLSGINNSNQGSRATFFGHKNETYQNSPCSQSAPLNTCLTLRRS